MASIKAVSADAWCPSRPRVGTRPANNGNHQKLMEPQKPKDPYLEMLVPSCSFCGFSSAANILLYKNMLTDVGFKAQVPIHSSRLLKTTLFDVLNYVWLRIKHKASWPFNFKPKLFSAFSNISPLICTQFHSFLAPTEPGLCFVAKCQELEAAQPLWPWRPLFPASWV